MNQLILTPAYGRDYKSAKEVAAAFAADKDFQVATIGYGGGYTNRADLLNLGVQTVNIRYNKLRNVVVIPVK
jgi:hypothetical protein